MHKRFEEQWQADESRHQCEVEEETQRLYEEYLNEERGRQCRDKKAEEQAHAERDRFEKDQVKAKEDADARKRDEEACCKWEEDDKQKVEEDH